MKKYLLVLLLALLAGTAQADFNGPEIPAQVGHSGQFLTTDGTIVSWGAAGGGSIGGSTGSTDNAVLRADGTGGATLQTSPVIIADTTGVISGTQGVTFTGSSSGTTAVVPTAAASGTLTLPAATDTLVGKATTDTLTNKTFNTAGTGNTFQINGTGITAVTGTGSVVLGSGNPTITLANGTGLPISTGVSGLGTGVATFLGTPSSANLATAVTDETGSGALVFGTAPTITLANGTGLPISTGVSGLGTGIAAWLATPSSANLITAMTDETGTGALVFAASPTFTGTVSGAAATWTGVDSAAAQTVTGSTASVNGLYLPAASTPTISANSIDVVRFNTVASGVNYLTVTPSIGTNTVTIGSGGTGATVPITLDAKGTSSVEVTDVFKANGGVWVAGNSPVTGFDGIVTCNTHTLCFVTNFGGGGGTQASIDSNGVFLSQLSSPISTLDAAGSATNGGFQMAGSSNTSSTGTANWVTTRATADALGASFIMDKNRNTSEASNTIVQSGDVLGNIVANGANGTGYTRAAMIVFKVDGTPGASADMPGSIDLQVTPDGSGTPASGLKVANTKAVTVGGTLTVTTFGGATATTVCQSAGLLSACSSSQRYKENIRNADYGLKTILDLRPVVFDWKDGHEKDDIGMIAEEAAKVDERLITHKDGKIEGIKYTPFDAVLVKSDQDLNAKIEAQQKQIDALVKELAVLKKASHSVHTR